MNTQNPIIWKRGAVLVSVVALSAGELLAQGTSPWLKRLTCYRPLLPDPLRGG